ncbi:GNAT family N-acetyltransferase [Rubinisphaera margarita]|uniref:GNAT family N-acetyltransferase n=1 Tax=Rubinisphaera margarita TaxID=2909586 RepID=UPI001EE7E31B|nr:GNAT family N-acetyltransferase [Rubinisphaera margarita]MCG6156586.1 GNAT family N-acetyltransferase [Rubinisphaera margarita]
MVVDHAPNLIASIAVSSPLESYSRSYSTRIDIDDEYVIETVGTVTALAGYLPSWKKLASDCLVSNPFYEPFFLLPTLQRLPAEGPVCFAFVFRKADSRGQEDQLVGFFPLEKRSNGVLSRPRWRLLTNSLMLRAVPLLGTEHPERTIAAFLTWATRSDLGLLEFDRVLAEGAFQHALICAFQSTGTAPYIVGQTTNAVLTKRSGTAEPSKKAMREIQRKRRRLEDIGDLQCRVLDEHESLDAWQHGFLRLEASGWKGRGGTAMVQSDQERDLFLTVTRQGWARRKLQMFGLFLDGRPIAMKCNLHSGREGMAWKIAFDEAFSKYSPGLILEVEHKQSFDQQSELDRIDFCARASHPLCQRLPHEQLCMQRLLIPCGSLRSELYCSTLSFLRRVKRHAERSRR